MIFTDFYHKARELYPETNHWELSEAQQTRVRAAVEGHNNQIKEASTQRAREAGIDHINFTIAWYQDEHSIWAGPTAFDRKGIEVEIPDDLHTFLDQVYWNDPTIDTGEYQWNTADGQFIKLRDAYVSEPELFYE